MSTSAPGRAMPQAYRALRLNAEALDQLLARAPQESPDSPELLAQSPVVISLPLPEGGFTRFRIVESPMMEPALAAQFPQIKTYNGQGIDDPAATMRCDLSPRGFHAMALLAKGAIYVDPYGPDEQRAYISYYKQDYVRGGVSWGCSVPDQDRNDDGAERRAALDALASELDTLESNGLADETRIAAWSPRSPSPSDATNILAQVKERHVDA